MISLSFISISTKITESLKNNNTNNKNIKENNDMREIILNSEKAIEIIWNKTIFIENTKLEKSLKSNEVYIIEFNTNSIIDLNITNSWIILYSTGTTNQILTWSLNSINISSWETLTLSNYSWYTKFILNSDNKFEIPEKKYKIVESIWNKQIIKTRWKLK